MLFKLLAHQLELFPQEREKQLEMPLQRLSLEIKD